MTECLYADELLHAPTEEIGGKAEGLRSLVVNGAPVPAFGVVSAASFRAALGTTNVPALLGALRFAAVDTSPDQLHALFEQASGDLRREMEAIELASIEALCVPLLDYLGHLDHLGQSGPEASLAVRSSMVGEDSAHASFAGQLWTGVGIAPTPAAVAAAIRTCWASIFTPHALWYSHSAGSDLTVLRMAVVVQKMVDADSAGVVFTADPRSGDRDVAVISAAWGLGEAVVGGLVDCDEYRVRNGLEIEAHQGGATERIVSGEGGHTHLAALDAELVGVRVLTADQTIELADQGQRLANRCGYPLDIEFAYAGGTLQLLQARPITALPPAPAPQSDEEEWLWDDANIQESFCGVTLPLTFSFASKVYQLVYTSLGDLLGVGDTILEEHADMVRTMIGLLDGRVYYNLNAWFEGLSLYPSTGNNKADMERMMGVEEPVPFVVDQTSTALEKAQMMARIAPAAVRLAPQYLRLPEGIAAFDARLADLERSVNRDWLRAASIGECLAFETKLWNEVLRRWQVPLINDFRVMLTSGNLRRLLEKCTPEVARQDRLEVELLAAIEGLASVEPTRAMMRIAHYLRENPATEAIFMAGDPVAALAAARAQDPALDRLITDYLEAFGGRCMGELKLETITLHQDPSFLVEIVRSYVPRPDLNPEDMAREEHIRYRAAVEELGVLAGPRGRTKALKLVESVRVAIAAREHLRLSRTRVFDLVRELYLGIGARLHEAGRLDHPRDIFYLTTDEVRGFHEGTTVTTNLRGLVNLRRAEFDEYETRTPAHRIPTRGTVHLTPTFAATHVDTSEQGLDGSVSWHGLGCYPGIVEGEAVVVTDPSSASKTAGKVLVAVRTDPGWAPLFPTAIGLVVERGSSLSHSAVIAREIGLPTVVGVGGVTTSIRTGAAVRVDGGAGIVTMFAEHGVTEHGVTEHGVTEHGVTETGEREAPTS